ncbi:MAG: manganese catalase family protein [Negativicutes bacterium]|nr:manganese catalase family protein [Negativicutes bacterium]
MNDFSLSQAYPVPRVAEENRYYAMLLLEDYAGAAGELTAVTQYMYHSICLNNDNCEVAALSRQIAIAEMRHVELLGKTIELLGVPPTFRCVHHNTSDFWTAKYVYYGSDIADRLSADIAKEAAVIHNYNLHLKIIDDPFIKNLLKRILLDEELHLRLFQQAKDSLSNKLY